jgi:DDE superfamily endonuclease
LKKQWCIPPEQNAEFVYRMEDILEVYSRPYRRRFPVICMDEAGKQLVAETRLPLAIQPGKPPCYDYEYQRNGTCNLFVFCQPLTGWRHVEVTERKTRTDWAHAIRDLVDVRFPKAEKIVLVMVACSPKSDPCVMRVQKPLGGARRTLDVTTTEAT